MIAINTPVRIVKGHLTGKRGTVINTKGRIHHVLVEGSVLAYLEDELEAL